MNKNIIYLQDKNGVGFLNLVFLLGRAYDKDTLGLSNFASGVLEEGIDDEFIKELERRGIVLECKTGFNTLTIKLIALSEHFSYATLKLKELLLSPNTSDKIITRVKNNINALIEYNQSDFNHLAKVGFNEKYFNHKDFIGGVIGDKKSVNDINKTHLNDYFTRLIKSPCMMIAGGEIDTKALDKLKSLLNLSSFKLKSYQATKSFISSLKDKDTKQAYIYFGSEFNASYKEYAKLKIASFVLGEGSFGSRLMESVRVKNGLAYSVYGGMDIGENYSRFFGALQTKCENAQKSIDIVKYEVENFFKNGISFDEYESAVKFLKGSYVLRYETTSKQMDIKMLEMIKNLEDDFYKKLYQNIDKTSFEEVNDFIKSNPIKNISFFVLNNESI